MTHQAYKRQAFKDGIVAAETYLAGGDKSLMNAPYNMTDDEGYELGMIWSRGFNFALVLAGICKMSLETEQAVRLYEPEYFVTNLPSVELVAAEREAVFARQRARLLAKAKAVEATVRGEYFVVGNPHSPDQFQIWALTTGDRAAHTPLFKVSELPLVQKMTDALNDAYCAGILQGNRTRPEHEGLERLAKRVASLNPHAGEIGAGMLASLVAEARALVS